MTTTREWKTQSLCLHCGKSEINHHPCVVAPGIWLCRPCANKISNPQLRQLREDTLRDLCNQGPVEFLMSGDDGFETLDNEYEELMLQDSWETHLAPCPEGLFLIRSDFCADSAEILHVITDPSNDDNTVAAILEQPDEDRATYFFQQENGELERLNCRQFHTNMKYINPSSENRWSYPTSPSAPSPETAQAHGGPAHPGLQPDAGRPPMACPQPHAGTRVPDLRRMPGTDAPHHLGADHHPGLGKTAPRTGMFLPTGQRRPHAR